MNETSATRFPCGYLGGDVEMTRERERHIAERHPELLPEHRARIAETLAKPDQIRASTRFGNAKLFSRWYADLRKGKHVIVIVVSETAPRRHWIITAYISGKLTGGKVEWTRN